LLSQGVNPDTRDTRNSTPLWWAARGGHEAIVRCLLDTSIVDIDARDDVGRTPLFWAAANGYERVVKLLLVKGAIPYVADKDGHTPLSIAKKNGEYAVVTLM
ncbi:ankyrin repeat-containing domain protein, partial [Phaeosphaeriaceae sp. PMI808]